ncbi:class D sortase [Paenibacillus macerans]|uniref:Sortase n=1 Tax=Paenibacillus macerans TaxID=44252 RepID=A0A090ZG76_PAEMA|nr:class D sortase [Paenibacillus macerans]KFN09612.1 sortase family protein [Paenibacillus macerans]MBS5912726.1 class D sortase [Paenibacillus macerans]MCY7562387.1 class D sortase [Paenibacillus macerans]MDU5946355.1 class D sortase [Paenibacillus macerans]MEC0141007.1 class D sortase [Paenibacillus macerans]
MRKLSYLLILLGIAVIVAPMLMEWQADREQQRLLAEAEQARKQREAAAMSRELAAGFERLSHLLEEGSSAADSEPAAVPQLMTVDGKTSIAMIEIAAIDVKLPVLEGATKANMKHAAAHMTETAPLGAEGNAAIAAHRARTKGRLFNRLNEVEIGDKIVITTESDRYTYEVYKISIVEPTEVSVLKPNGKDKILTLITCDPLKNPTHRLIVQAKMKQVNVPLNRDMVGEKG